MQLSFIFTTLISFAAIAVAYPTPELGTQRTCKDSCINLRVILICYAALAKRGGLGSDLTRYLNARAPDVSHPSAPNDPDDPQGPMSNDR
jgi:hypothetical protein